MAHQRSERTWIRYDVANSAYVLIVTTAIFPLFYKNVIAAECQEQYRRRGWYPIALPRIGTAVWHADCALTTAADPPGRGAMRRHNRRRRARCRHAVAAVFH